MSASCSIWTPPEGPPPRALFLYGQDTRPYFRDPRLGVRRGPHRRHGPLAAARAEHISADHYPFMAAGVPSAFLRDPGFSISAGFYHTAHDTVDKLRLMDIREAAFLAARLMWRVANEDRWPFSRTPAEERLRLQREYDRLEVRRVEAEVEKLRARRMER